MCRFRLFLVWMAGCHSPAGALVPTRAQVPSQGKDQLLKEIDGLVRQLGSDSFREREEAQRKLLKIGAAAKKQLREASKSDDKEVVRRAAAILDELRKQDLARAEVHVVGVYESRARKAVVEVREAKKPVILVLCAYESVTWSVQAAKDVEVVQVIASGYHKQAVEGVKVPVFTYSYDERSQGKDGRPFYFYTYDHDEEKYPNMVTKVRQLTGKKVTSFQGRYSFKKVPFVIGGEE
jgi:hypothetical protein